MYIADAWNNRICKVSSTGVITTIAGTGVAGFSGDGGHASAAQLSKPTDVAIDAAGNVYISDQQNDCVRKINAAGIISTYAGMGGMAGYSGDGGQATVASINYCEYIQLYDGNLYLGDKLNNVIRQVNTSGIITTFAGNGIGGYSDDGGPATSAEFYYPEAITFDICGNMYISDWYNNRIRKIPSLTTSSEQGCNSSQGIEDFTNGNNIAIYPNPSAGIIKI